MAEATLNDVTKGLQQVSEAIREQTIADGKADPAKSLKEEFVSVLSQRRFSKKSIQQGDKIEKAEVKRTKREEDSNKKDLGHYKKFEQCIASFKRGTRSLSIKFLLL